jgi:hypothetical protein
VREVLVGFALEAGPSVPPAESTQAGLGRSRAFTTVTVSEPTDFGKDPPIVTHRGHRPADPAPLCFVGGCPLRAVVQTGILDDQTAVGTVRLGVVADELHTITFRTAARRVRRRFVGGDVMTRIGTLIGPNSRVAGRIEGYLALLKSYLLDIFHWSSG